MSAEEACDLLIEAIQEPQLRRPHRYHDLGRVRCRYQDAYGATIVNGVYVFED